MKAADALGARLHFIKTENPGAEILVVAHSHGGNVAMEALGRRTDLEGVRLATLATPFLSLGPAQPVKWYTALTFLLLVGLGPMWIASILSVSVGVDSVEQEVSDAAMGVGISFGVALALAIVLSAWCAAGHAGSSIMKELRGPTAIDMRVAPDIHERLLVVRSNGDEAGASLAFAHLYALVISRIGRGIARTMNLLHLRQPKSFFRRLLVFYAVYGLFFALVALLAYAIGAPAEDGFAIGAIAMYTVPLLIATAQLPFGIDLLHLGLTNPVRAEAAPSGNHHVLHVNHDDPTESGLAHGVYDSEDAIRALVKFGARSGVVVF